eukprot:948601-Rhodomonas_salina.1
MGDGLCAVELECHVRVCLRCYSIRFDVDLHLMPDVSRFSQYAHVKSFWVVVNMYTENCSFKDVKKAFLRFIPFLWFGSLSSLFFFAVWCAGLLVRIALKRARDFGRGGAKLTLGGAVLS